MLELDVAPFKNITECDQISSQTVEARVHGRVFRVTAARDLKGESGEFWALCEEQLPIETIGKDYTVWVRASEFPWASGEDGRGLPAARAPLGQRRSAAARRRVT